ncbi:MAG TPA: hypothetical protein VIA18_13785, partial [Polyangia bacterium]|nr:hypothetical protein [Polyangia bacterium]
RAARLAFAAGRTAERLGDTAAARERYQAALELDPEHAHALRGLRRLRLGEPGPREPLLTLIDREIARAAHAEKRGLVGIKAEVALSGGEEPVARAAYAAILEEQPGDLSALTGLVDLAASNSDDELAAALGQLSAALGNTVDAATRAALLVERGRLDEAAERVPDAVARFGEALHADPTAAAAAWGLLRVAVRTPGVADDLDTHARLNDLLPPGPLKQALSRRLGVLRTRQNDFAGARPPLQAAAADGDRLALLDLSQLERADNRIEEAAGALARAAEGEPDAGKRADRLVSLGELHETQGNTAAAAAAYLRAATDYPDDPRAARALERTQAAGGDKESALARHLAAAERSPARAPMELTYAARLLRELGRADEALSRLAAALTTAPTFVPAIELAVELQLAAARPDDAALVLVRASEAVDEPGLMLAYRMRATRVLLRAGRHAEALAIVRPLVGSDGLRAARWLEQRVLRQAEGQGDALRESLRAEAESAELSGDRPRAAALAYELGIATLADDEALELLRRALAAEPLDGAAAAEIVARLDDERRGAEIPATLQARIQSASGRAEAVALYLRLGASLLEDAADPAAAERAYAEAAQLAPGYAPAREGLDRVARYSDDSAAHLAALERERLDATQAEQRFAVEMLTGELLERAQGAPEKAAERYRLALAERPHHPVARQALERAYEAARNHSALADLALGDLKEAADPQAKVAAYERLAYIDGELRGDRQSALLGWESILEVDHANHTAMRILEKHYLLEQRWPELVALYEQMGLTAVDSAFAVAVHLDRARLRRRVGEVSEEERTAAVANDYRLALFKDPRSRTALRHVYARARAARDLLPMAETAAALAEAAGDDPRTAAVMLTRAAEALVELDRADEARTRYEAA